MARRLKLSAPRFETFRFSAAQFLIVLVLLFCISPLVENMQHGDLIETMLLTAVLISAVPAVGGTRRTLIVAALLGLPALFGKWAHYYLPGPGPAMVFLGAALLFAIFIVLQHLRFILFAERVDVHVLCAGISTFLMLGLLFAFSYMLLDNLTPGAFQVTDQGVTRNSLTGFDASFYSFSTLSGTSYNFVTPVSNMARMLTLVETIVGLFYLAVLISRLVALHTAEQQRP